MSLHLAGIGKTARAGVHAVVLVEQAGWHLSHQLVVRPDLTLFPLPPRRPELNPVENVGQFMRDNWLSNRVLGSCADIVDPCREAWNKLADQPWRTMSRGTGRTGSDQAALILAWRGGLLATRTAAQMRRVDRRVGQDRPDGRPAAPLPWKIIRPAR